jgi:hypothetical protein
LLRILKENNGKPKAGNPSARFEQPRQEGFSDQVGVVDLAFCQQYGRVELIPIVEPAI